MRRRRAEYAARELLAAICLVVVLVAALVINGFLSAAAAPAPEMGFEHTAPPRGPTPKWGETGSAWNLAPERGGLGFWLCYMEQATPDGDGSQ